MTKFVDVPVAVPVCVSPKPSRNVGGVVSVACAVVAVDGGEDHREPFRLSPQGSPFSSGL
ncbi:hypothetical protein [Amycolatopsis pretoriensis]|uniref:hypothetical protein n=1 Tax=Amycolatopsis pretoriensis TaxID=218821 RepID=UPI00146F94E2|nr:hypothetical protein [Amycolatopsis pretoriensis]